VKSNYFFYRTYDIIIESGRGIRNIFAQKGNEEMSIKCDFKKRLLPIMVVALLFVTVSFGAAPTKTYAATANWDTYTGVKISNNDYFLDLIAPEVVYTSVIKSKSWFEFDNSGITFYTNGASAVLVGQKVKIGFSTDKNESKASKKVYKVLQKAVKIKNVKWYTKDSKGKVVTISKKKSLVIPKSVKGKQLYVKYQWTIKGVKGTQLMDIHVGGQYNSGLHKSGMYKYAYEGVATKGRLHTSVSLEPDYVFAGDTLKAMPTTTYEKRFGEADKKISKVKYTYQWYLASENKKGEYIYAKIKGATKASYKVPAGAKGKEIFVNVIAKKSGYYSASYDTFKSVSSVARSADIQ
jgi:hypothetical protein